MLPVLRLQASGRGLTGLVVAALFGALLLILPQAPTAHADVNAHGGDFVPFGTDTRVLDTRSGIGISGTAKLGPGVDKPFQVLGVGSVPASGVAAVMATVSIYDPTAGTLFKVWPDGTPMPTDSVQHSIAANPNFSNSLVVPVGSNGKLRIYNSGGSAHAIVDIQGYFTTTSIPGGTGGFVPVTPKRIVDSRSNLGTTGGNIAPGASRTITLATAGVPSNATSAFVNLLIPSAATNGSMAFGGSVFNYASGPSSSGMSVKLSAGKATLHNSSSASAVPVVVDLLGYFAPSSTLGAGYRPALGRLYDSRTGSQLAAGATVDIQVGGAVGLPVQGVAGALLNIHTSGVTGGADAFVAWPTGSTRPGTSSNNNPGSVSRASLNVIRPGTDGKVSIRNLGTHPADVYVEIEGWFADALPTVPIEQNSRVAIVQATPVTAGTPRPLELTYVNNSGQLVQGEMANPDLLDPSQGSYQTLSGGEPFTGTPGLAEQANGKLVVAGHHTESNVWAITESSKVSPPVWPTTWAKLGGSITSHPAMIKLSDGRLAIFGVDTNGALWVTSQTAASSGAWNAWHNLGDVDLVGTPVVITNPAGVVQVFSRTTAGTIVTATYTVGGVLSAWAALGNPGVALDGTAGPAAVAGPTGSPLIRVFVRTPSGDIATKQQAVGGSWPAAWQTIPGVVSAGPPTAVLHPVNGTYQVFVRTPANRPAWATELTRDSGTWSTWKTSVMGSLLVTDPTAFTWVNSNGTSFGLVYRIGTDQIETADYTPVIPPGPAGAQAAQAKATATAAAAAPTRAEPRFASFSTAS